MNIDSLVQIREIKIYYRVLRTPKHTLAYVYVASIHLHGTCSSVRIHKCDSFEFIWDVSDDGSHTWLLQASLKMCVILLLMRGFGPRIIV